MQPIAVSLEGSRSWDFTQICFALLVTVLSLVLIAFVTLIAIAGYPPPATIRALLDPTSSDSGRPGGAAIGCCTPVVEPPAHVSASR